MRQTEGSLQDANLGDSAMFETMSRLPSGGNTFLSEYNIILQDLPLWPHPTPQFPVSSLPSVLLVVGCSQKTCFVWFQRDIPHSFIIFKKLNDLSTLKIFKNL